MSLRRASGPCPDLTLHQPGRGRVPLSHFWQDGPAVFVFLRHFG